MGEKSCWKVDLQDIQKVLISLAKQAGELILTANPTTTDSGTKNNSADLVTETDKLVEKMISTTLMAKYPTFKFLGEETYQPGMKLGPEPTFVVDPIDGTTNFVHQYPYVSVSLGLAIHKIPAVGVVYNPFSGKLYTGIKGEGSFVHNLVTGTKHQLPLRPTGEFGGLDGTLVAIEWGSDRSGQNWKTKCDTWTRLGRTKEEGGAMVHSARALGSAALNLCAVAEGSIDIYWEGGCWPWDVCAGWVILSEAGGIIVDGNPGGWEIPIDHRKYLAVKGAQSGQREVIEEFWSHIEGNMEYEC